MSDGLARLAGPHGGGYLLLILLPFGGVAAVSLLYLVGFGILLIRNAYWVGSGWLW